MFARSFDEFHFVAPLGFDFLIAHAVCECRMMLTFQSFDHGVHELSRQPAVVEVGRLIDGADVSAFLLAEAHDYLFVEQSERVAD